MQRLLGADSKLLTDKAKDSILYWQLTEDSERERSRRNGLGVRRVGKEDAQPEDLPSLLAEHAEPSPEPHTSFSHSCMPERVHWAQPHRRQRDEADMDPVFKELTV